MKCALKNCHLLRQKTEGSGMVGRTGPHCQKDDQLERNLFNLLLRFFLLYLLLYLTHDVMRLGICCINAVIYLKEFLQVLQNTCRNHLLCSSGCRLLLRVLGGTDTKMRGLYATSQFIDTNCNFKVWSKIQS